MQRLGLFSGLPRSPKAEVGEDAWSAGSVVGVQEGPEGPSSLWDPQVRGPEPGRLLQPLQAFSHTGRVGEGTLGGDSSTGVRHWGAGHQDQLSGPRNVSRRLTDSQGPSQGLQDEGKPRPPLSLFGGTYTFPTESPGSQCES